MSEFQLSDYLPDAIPDVNEQLLDSAASCSSLPVLSLSDISQCFDCSPTPAPSTDANQGGSFWASEKLMQLAAQNRTHRSKSFDAPILRNMLYDDVKPSRKRKRDFSTDSGLKAPKVPHVNSFDFLPKPGAANTAAKSLCALSYFVQNRTTELAQETQADSFNSKLEKVTAVCPFWLQGPHSYAAYDAMIRGATKGPIRSVDVLPNSGHAAKMPPSCAKTAADFCNVWPTGDLLLQAESPKPTTNLNWSHEKDCNGTFPAELLRPEKSSCKEKTVNEPESSVQKGSEKVSSSKGRNLYETPNPPNRHAAETILCTPEPSPASAWPAYDFLDHENVYRKCMDEIDNFDF